MNWGKRAMQSNSDIFAKFSFYDWSPEEETPQGAIRVVVADSTRMASELLANVLKRDSDINVVAATSGSTDIAHAVLTLNPEVLLLSANLDSNDAAGFEIAGDIQMERPKVRIVMLLDVAPAAVVVSAFRAGCSGVFTRDGSLDSLCKCIRSVSKGQIWANNEQIRFLLEALASRTRVGIEQDKLACLTKREREVVGLAAEGLTNREIAAALRISEHTVKNYMFSIFEKLGVSSRVELAFGPAGRPRLLSMDRTEGNLDPVAWLRDLADQGTASAQLLLAELLHHGRFVAPDPVSAYQWYLVAEHSDGHAGEHARRRLAKEMNPSDVAKAESRAMEWLARKNKLARRA